MGLFKKLKKLKLKDVAKVVKTVASFVPGASTVVAAINVAEKVAGAIGKAAKGVGDVAGRVAEVAGGVGRGLSQIRESTGPPKPAMNVGMVALIIAAAWILLSPNPGIIYSLFGAGTVVTKVGRRRRVGGRLKAETKIAVTAKKARRRTASKKRKTTTRRTTKRRRRR